MRVSLSRSTVEGFPDINLCPTVPATQYLKEILMEIKPGILAFAQTRDINWEQKPLYVEHLIFVNT